MFEISFSPVRAVIVTKPLMSVPALVMNCFAPLMTQSPSSSFAVVLVLPASEPASGSVSPNEPSFSRPAEQRQPLLLLRVAAERVDRPGGERRVRRHGDRHARVHPRELLDHERVGERVGPAAAVLLGVGHAHQPELAELGDDLVGEALLLVELLGDRPDLVLREVAREALDRLLLVGQVEVHGRGMLSGARSRAWTGTRCSGRSSCSSAGPCCSACCGSDRGLLDRRDRRGPGGRAGAGDRRDRGRRAAAAGLARR